MVDRPVWVVLVWRLPSASSAHRVATWRALHRLGAVALSPGAAILPFCENLQEQLDWLAQEIEDERGGEAWVLPTLALSQAEERRVRARMAAEREEEYHALEREATAFLERAPTLPGPDSPDFAARMRAEKELLALQRRFRKARERDYVGAPGRAEAAAAIDRCLAYRQGISRKLAPVTDAAPA